jgi:signal peptidase I
LEEWGVSLSSEQDKRAAAQGYFHLDNAQVEKIKSLGPNYKVERPSQDGREPGYIFPNDAKRYGGWSVDDFGPIWIPKKGVTTPLNLDNLPFYRRIIAVFEGNKLEVRGDKIFINDQEANAYTFKQDYYWMMGDNRHNSEDSRIWGYVPEDHIVGKPLFIWFSLKDGPGNFFQRIQWNRIFKSASTM